MLRIILPFLGFIFSFFARFIGKKQAPQPTHLLNNIRLYIHFTLKFPSPGHYPLVKEPETLVTSPYYQSFLQVLRGYSQFYCLCDKTTRENIKEVVLICHTNNQNKDACEQFMLNLWYPDGTKKFREPVGIVHMFPEGVYDNIASLKFQYDYYDLEEKKDFQKLVFYHMEWKTEQYMRIVEYSHILKVIYCLPRDRNIDFSTVVKKRNKFVTDLISDVVTYHHMSPSMLKAREKILMESIAIENSDYTSVSFLPFDFETNLSALANKSMLKENNFNDVIEIHINCFC